MLGKLKTRLKSIAGFKEPEQEGAGCASVPLAERLDAMIQEAAGDFEGGRMQQAAETCLQMLALQPEHPKALNLYGVISFVCGRKEEGITLLRRAIAAQPDFASAHGNLGRALKEFGQLDEAERCLRQALALKPDYPEACSLLANVLALLNKRAEAELCYRSSLALRPDCADDHVGLGIVLAEQGKFEEAVQAYRDALTLDPRHNAASLNLGCLFNLHGRLGEAIEVYRRRLDLDPPDPVIHSNLLLCLNYHPETTSAELHEEHRRWNLLHGRPRSAKILPFRNNRLPERVLRIGYVSADFGLHPIGFFLASVLPEHDRKNFHITCYSGRSVEDDYTVRLRKSSDIWHVVKGLDDDALAGRIREDGIDILVDLSGHTHGSRLTMFAQKPAPVQMTWAGYVGSTGLSAMDYLISDRMESPDGAERFCSEKILRLPKGYLCYEPPAYAPPVDVLPLLRNDYITFGSFNNTAKVTRQVVALWAQLLRELPTARLVLRYPGYEHALVQSRYFAMFAAEGIERSRISLCGGVPHPELLRCYNDIDIALDPFPYSGGLTTMEALWMGVPVITLGGERFCSRHSVSHLTNVGLPELIASDEEGFLAIARKLVGEPERLKALRASLREKVSASPLCDGAGFTRSLEGAFREAWRKWCDQQEGASCGG